MKMMGFAGLNPSYELAYSRVPLVNIARNLSHNSIRTPFLRMTRLC